ncbi:hypothetical protein GYMLUDRAFT_379193 [Collybiopsis luxurians FD-317 M1]|nr:hypothetical protein GYMLUDRAFT_379193 [Collybiopsis luxurians FD-317 M1]
MIELTGHVRSDITLLSSILSGRQLNSSPLPPYKSNKKPDLLAYISAILTIGNDSDPVAHSVHAVSGRIEPNLIECIVCVENPGQAQDRSISPPTAIPTVGRLEEVEGVEDANRGAQLLKRWDEPIEKGFNQREYPFKQHLRDVFQILSHFCSCNTSRDSQDIFDNFVFLIHSRAFRKLGWRIEEFLTRWGRMPFLVIREGIDIGSVQPSRIYHEKFSYSEVRILDFSEFPCLGNISIKNISKNEWQPCELQVHSQNVEQWLDSFVQHFEQLKKLFPKPNHDLPAPLPLPNKVVVGVIYLQCLVKLKPVIKYILTIPGVEKALLDTEDTMEIHELMKPEDDHFLHNFIYPSDPEHKNDKQHHECGIAAEQSNEGKNDEDQWLDDKDEKDDLLYDAVINPANSTDNTGGGRLLQSLDTITAWLVSSRSLSTRAHQFLGKRLSVKYLSCPEVPPAPAKCDLNMKTKLDVLFPDLNLRTDQRNIESTMRRWDKAKLHPEATLMAWVFGEGKEEAVRTANIHSGDVQFSLSDTHNSICPWIPPREVPNDILIELRRLLLGIIDSLTGGHPNSRQSSGPSFDVDHHYRFIT